MANKFRILSLSGGGVRGIYIASLIAEIESTARIRVRDYFDLITGTSTGGLIAIALAFGKSGKEILENYRTHIPKIFPRTYFGKPYRVLRQYWSHKYHPGPLETAIRELIGDKYSLFDARNRLCIPTVYFDDMWPTVLKTRHHKKLVRDHKLPAWHAAMATAAAPTYFPALRAGDGRTFWDGGLWANNPTLVGVVEAVGLLGVPPSNIEVLSIGTTETVVNPDHRVARSGAGRLLRLSNPLLLEFMCRLSERAASTMSGGLCGSAGVCVVDDLVGGGGFRMDDAHKDTLRALETRGRVRAGVALEAVSARFFDTAADVFESVPLAHGGSLGVGAVTTVSTNATVDESRRA